MANLKISQMTSGSPAQSGDLLPIDRSGTNFSVSASGVAALATITTAVANGGVVPPANGGSATSATASQDYYFLPIGIIGLSQSTTTGTSGLNAVKALQFTLDRSVTFTRMTVNVTITSSTNHEFIGIYNAAGTSLLIQGSFTLGAGTGALTATVSSTTLAPGIYWLARSADNTTSTLESMTGTGSTAVTLLNSGSIKRCG